MKQSFLFAALLFALPALAQSGDNKPFVVHPQSDQIQQLEPISNCDSPKTIPELLKALDKAVSGPATKDFSCLKEVFGPGGRLIIVQKLAGEAPDGSNTVIRAISVEQYIEIAKHRKEALTEHQTGYKADKFDNIANIWTTYDVYTGASDKPVAQGVNALQAIYNGKAWHLLEIVWQTSDKDNPLPSLPLVQ